MMFVFNTSDSFLGDTNNDLHFDEFILNCQIICHNFSVNNTRDMSNIKNLYMNNNSDKFLLSAFLNNNKMIYKLFHLQNIFF